MPNLTNALTALASHYQANPDLPAWDAIDYSHLDRTIRVRVGDVDPAAEALIDWANTLEDYEIWVSRHQLGWARTTFDQVQIRADIDGVNVVIWREVPGFGTYIGAPDVDGLGKQVLVQADIETLRDFHAEGHDADFGLAA